MVYLDDRVVYLVYRGIPDEYLNSFANELSEKDVNTHVIYLNMENIHITSILMWYYMLYKDMIKDKIKICVITDYGCVEWYWLYASGSIETNQEKG